ncbi:spatacsin [Brachionus plicatilis]|uniref:Spatacsin n=1 Tax=Brachionus plicatilis TaxID=10195 RepID=A0A3M7S516_BRAPC|nr:spatacsin [Brachionus plicatilis]
MLNIFYNKRCNVVFIKLDREENYGPFLKFSEKTIFLSDHFIPYLMNQDSIFFKKYKGAYILLVDLRSDSNMIYICLEMINPEELDYSNQPIDTTSFKTTRLTNVLRSLSRPNEPLEASNAKMQFLDKLVYLCNYGNKFSKRIKLDFLLSNEILKMPYLKLLNENQWVILKNLLYSQNQSKFSVAKEFVKIYDLNKSVLADFVLNEFLLNLKTANDPNLILMLDPFDGKQFSKLVKIFDKEINLFGNKLLEKTRYLLSRPKTTEDFTLLTELIIRSHDCFTQSCSMEGISSVLQACKICAGKMLKAEEFDLMIRLLIEIGHYSEMTYIMDYLWNNQHFDMLIGKGKDNKLRLALLNYLKRHHPNDHNTYTMITLHFTMHREIAKMLEDAAYEQLKLLEDKTLEFIAILKLDKF